MCISICGEIIEIDDNIAIVSVLGVEVKVNIELIEEPEIGDNIIIHCGYAIEKVSKEYSKEITILLKEFDDELSADT